MDKTKTASGLSQTEADRLLGQFGPNQIEAKKTSLLTKLAKWLVSPMSLLLIAAAGLSFYSGKLFDGWFILFLFILNFLIGQWHERKADKAVATLQSKLAVKVQVERDGRWQLLSAENLVPGDLVQLEVGNIIPADVAIFDAKNLSINESVLTGESLPRDKASGEVAYTGSFITTGSLTGSVQSTGNRTKFGKTVLLVDGKAKHSALEADILTISRYLMIASLTAVLVISVSFLARHQSVSDLSRLDLSILIAGVPVAMPTVMSLIISLGVVQLSRRNVIVRRLSSLEDLANVNLLLSDKTGTLTENKIKVEEIVTYGQVERAEAIRWAVSATSDNRLDPLNQAVIALANQNHLKAFARLDFIPADSKRKRSTATLKVGQQTYIASLGAAQIIESLCKLDAKTRRQLRRDVEQAAAKGYRVLALASGEGKSESGLKLLALLLLSDSLREDAKQVIGFMNQHGIEVKMMTGDNRAIAARVAADLGLRGEIKVASTNKLSPEDLQKTAVFAEVLPEDKFRIVELSAGHYVAAATGDGVNDLPALKQASVGIAVSNAVDALKSSADIVLMTNGIGVIKDAIIEARKIFMRTYYYSVYRISESFRLILSIAILSLLYGSFPLTPVQIILLALLNDLPIITLAYDRVQASTKPAVLHVRERFELATLFGLVGVGTSLSLFILMKNVLHLDTPVIQTMFFLKLAVSGHMLIYVAHTRQRWWRWLPSRQIIWATSLTQLSATAIALSGVLFQRITPAQALLVWLWAFGWMQICELCKYLLQNRLGVKGVNYDQVEARV